MTDTLTQEQERQYHEKKAETEQSIQEMRETQSLIQKLFQSLSDRKREELT